MLYDNEGPSLMYISRVDTPFLPTIVQAKVWAHPRIVFSCWYCHEVLNLPPAHLKMDAVKELQSNDRWFNLTELPTTI